MNRLLKQILIAVVFVFLTVNIGLGSYYFLFTKKPEQSLVLKSPIEEIQILWLDYVIINENVYNIIARIKNPNLDYAALNFEYEFLFLNEQEEVISAEAGFDYINANQEKYLIIPNYKLDSIPASISLVLTPEWFKLIKLIDSQLKIGDSSADETAEIYKITSSVTNNSNFDFGQVDIRVVLKDQDSHPITSNYTLIEDLKSKQKQEFSFAWPKPLSWPPDAVADIDIEAYTNEIIKLSIH